MSNAPTFGVQVATVIGCNEPIEAHAEQIRTKQRLEVRPPCIAGAFSGAPRTGRQILPKTRAG
jgi:hypothetical protein